MAYICASVILGGRNPLLLKLTSSPAEGTGALLSLLILTWAKTLIPVYRNRVKKVTTFFMAKEFIVNDLI